MVTVQTASNQLAASEPPARRTAMTPRRPRVPAFRVASEGGRLRCGSLSAAPLRYDGPAVLQRPWAHWRARHPRRSPGCTRRHPGVYTHARTHENRHRRRPRRPHLPRLRAARPRLPRHRLLARQLRVGQPRHHPGQRRPLRFRPDARRPAGRTPCRLRREDRQPVDGDEGSPALATVALAARSATAAGSTPGRPVFGSTGS